MIEKLFKPRSLCISAVIAALYTALTLIFAPISFGNIQCRISEAMTLLPLLLPEAIPGLFIGCLISNIFGGAMMIDIILGSLTTLAAAILTWHLRKTLWMAALPPVALNGVIVGAIVHYCYAPAVPLLLCIAEVALGEAVAVYVLGTALVLALKKIDLKKLLNL
jgi:Predicted membrane protein